MQACSAGRHFSGRYWSEYAVEASDCGCWGWWNCPCARWTPDASAAAGLQCLFPPQYRVFTHGDILITGCRMQKHRSQTFQKMQSRQVLLKTFERIALQTSIVRITMLMSTVQVPLHFANARDPRQLGWNAW